MNPQNNHYIELKAQEPLALRRLWNLTITGLKQRIYRSFITILVVSVSTAFLVQFVLASLIGIRIEAKAKSELKEMQFASATIAYLAIEPTVPSVIRMIVEDPYPEIVASLFQHGKISDGEFNEFLSFIQFLYGMKHFEDSLSVIDRRELEWDEAYFVFVRNLIENERIGEFVAKLNPSLLRSLPDEWEAFIANRTSWAELFSKLDLLITNYTKSVRKFNELLVQDGPIGFLSKEPKTIQPALEEFGFPLSDEKLELLSHQANELQKVALLERRLNRTTDRRALAGLMNTAPEGLSSEMIWNKLRDPEFIAAFNRRLSAQDERYGLYDVDTVRNTAEYIAGIKRAEKAITNVSKAGLGIDNPVRIVIYLGVSLLVCLVGVSNALLMSVSERSREIATLKCIGALDGAILKMVFLEASLIGLVGGAIGALAGCLVALLPGMIRFGGYFFKSFGFELITMVSLMAMVMGLVVSLVASIYPALRASKLAPMEAMRID